MSDVRKTIEGGATWLEVADDRQRHRDATIASLKPALPELLYENLPHNVTALARQFLTDEELRITSSNVEDLIPKLASAEWSATIVIKAFLRRAGLAQKLTNCVTELLPQRALDRAKELDMYLQEKGKPVGPLHGVPISVKEHIGMKGLDLNAGFVSWVGRVGEDDALILKTLWDAGAVFYVRSTQPQTLMHLETSSNIYGVTVNPYNTTLTSGGSSGGEGALVGCRGSVLGIGSDIGGSIRSPAANNGVFGFKPTTGRLPVMGWAATMAGTEAIAATVGPLSTSFQGLEVFMKTVLDGKPWLVQPDLVALEWRDASKDWEGRKLKIGVMWEDGVVKPHPPVTRALREIVMKLGKSEKLEVGDWLPLRHKEAWSIIWILKDNPHVKHHDINSLWEACVKRDEYRQQYAAYWNDMIDGDGQPKFDVILCPAGPGVAPKVDTARYWGYTSQWNLLDYPAVIFPTAEHVSVEKDGGVVEHKPVGQENEYNWKLWEDQGAEGYQDAPISLQLVARRYEDEKLMRALEILLKEAGLPTTVNGCLPSCLPN